jgi:hypothetical protein
MVSTFGNGKGACEWDRLMRERNEMVNSGCYDEKDPVIMELDRQISVNQLRSAK